MKLLSFILLLPLISTCQITPERAKDSIGKKVTVCGTVADVHSGAKATFVNFGDYPNEVFTVVVFKDDIGNFSGLAALTGKQICVTGVVKLYKVKPEIVLKAAGQMMVK